MKIISWNCNMAFRNKIPLLLKLNPDLLFIQECEHTQKLERLTRATSNIWVGENKNKGVGIFGFHELKVQIHPNYNPNYKYIVPLIISKYKQLLIFVIWAMNNNKEPKRRYIGEVFNALQEYEEIFSPQIIIMGDFNWNRIWDDNLHYPLLGTFADVISLLEKNRIVSIYHNREKQNFGEETKPTFYQYRHANKSYHIDYMFASSELLPSVRSFQIGNYDQWITYSDHMPLLCDVNENYLK